MLHAQFFGKLASRLRPSGLHALVGFGQNAVKRSRWILPMPAGIVVQLRFSLRRDRDQHHASNLVATGTRVNCPELRKSPVTADPTLFLPLSPSKQKTSSLIPR